MCECQAVYTSPGDKSCNMTTAPSPQVKHDPEESGRQQDGFSAAAHRLLNVFSLTQHNKLQNTHRRRVYGRARLDLVTIDSCAQHTHTNAHTHSFKLKP